MSDRVITFAVPTYEDYHGAWFTLQSIRNQNIGADWLPHSEIIVVDNSPGSADGVMLRDSYKAWWAGPQPDGVAIKLVDLRRPVGAGNAKERAFREASGGVVLCLDSHVLLRPGAVEAVLAYFADPAHAKDMLTGPMLYDNQWTTSTHFADRWRGQMWGTWSSAWRTPAGAVVTPWPLPGGLVAARDVVTGQTVGSVLAVPKDAAGKTLDDVVRGFGWTLAAQGREPFAIGANGCGCFAMRRDAWVGFSPKFLGFGGEEWYVHTKVRQAGGQVVCHPALKWVHRFGRPGGPKFPLKTWYKVRNYVAGLTEIGESLDRCRRHFVEGFDEAGPGEPEKHVGSVFPPAYWELLLQNPAGPVPWPPHEPLPPELDHLDPGGRPVAAGGVPKPPCAERAKATLEKLYDQARTVKGDINEHVPTLKDLAAMCPVVVEFGTRLASSTVGLLAGQPEALITYDTQPAPPIVAMLGELRGRTRFEYRRESSLTAEPVDSDLLFIDTVHTENHLSAELGRHGPRCRRFIALHDTDQGTFGTRGEDGGPGLLSAVRDFLGRHPEWFVARHYPNNHGLTVLSRNPADKPAEPVSLWAEPHGPGTELKAILASLEVNPAPSCDCNTRARQMDEWGVAGCKANRETIIGWLKEGQGRWGWKDKLKAAALAVKTGLAFTLNPLDPFPGIVDEAVRRAEAKEAGAKAGAA